MDGVCNETTHEGCDANAICINGDCCHCNDGWHGNGFNCSDVDECDVMAPFGGLNNCSSQAFCTNTPGSFNCSCLAGFEGDGVTCTNIDECANATLNDCDQNTTRATCTDTFGSYTCACNAPGWQGPGTENCTDVDECDLQIDNCDGSVAATCTNTLGSFTCECNDGFNGTGVVCDDINECVEGVAQNISVAPCYINATCDNTYGSWECECNAG